MKLRSFVQLRRRRQRTTPWLDKAKQVQVKLELNNSAAMKQLEMIGITTAELQIAKAIQPLIVEHIETIVSAFYETITNVEHLKHMIVNNSTLDRLRKTLERHLIEMFSGEMDQNFLDKRIRIATIHNRIGLEPKWYLGAFQNLQNSLLQIVYHHIEDRDEMLLITQAITKILNFEQQLVLEAYEAEHIRQRQRQEDEIRAELKAKIIAVCEDMARITERTNTAVQELAANGEVLNESLLRGADASRSTQQLALDGQGKLLDLKTQIDTIFQHANVLKETVDRLNNSVQEIGKVIGIVQSVADETNLLSLNSSIEAARAGEYGAGFAVVSNEIRKLSSQTKASVDQIRSYINDTRNFTKQVVDVIDEVHHIIRDGKRESDATGRSFDHILDSMSVYLRDVEVVEDGMGSLISNINEIRQAMEKVSDSADSLYVAVENF